MVDIEKPLTWVDISAKILAMEAEGKISEAVTLLEKSGMQHHNRPELFYHLGRLMAKLENYTWAELALRRAMALRPEHLPATRQLLLIYERARRFADATAMLEIILKHGPELTGMRYRLGLAQLRTGDNAGAEISLRLVAEQDPHLGLALVYLAWALERLGRAGEAVTVLHQALTYKPDSPALHSHMGRLLEAQDPDAARISYGRALQLDPAEKTALAGLAKLAAPRSAAPPQASWLSRAQQAIAAGDKPEPVAEKPMESLPADRATAKPGAKKKKK